MSYVSLAITKNVRFFLNPVKEIQKLSDLLLIELRVTMDQVTKISKQIDGYFCDTTPELTFLFDSLLLSLKTASKNASSTSIARATPSIKHARNLSVLLETCLLKLPIPSLCTHVSDLFDYFQRTLEENSHVPISEELIELTQLTIELRKGINSLSNDRASKPSADTHNPSSEPNIVSS